MRSTQLNQSLKVQMLRQKALSPNRKIKMKPLIIVVRQMRRIDLGTPDQTGVADGLKEKLVGRPLYAQ
jgi:hypothetical protein